MDPDDITVLCAILYSNGTQQAQKKTHTSKVRIAIICWMQDSHSFEKRHSSTTKPNKTILVNFSKTAPQLCPKQAFTFQSSHFRVRHFLFKLRLTRDSFVFISIPGQETCLNYYQKMTMCIICLARTAR